MPKRSSAGGQAWKGGKGDEGTPHLDGLSAKLIPHDRLVLTGATAETASIPQVPKVITGMRIRRRWPQLTLVGIGVIAAALLLLALSEFFRLNNPKASVKILIGISAFAAVLAVAFLLWGAVRRARLIYELRESALDLLALVVRQDSHRDVGGREECELPEWLGFSRLEDDRTEKQRALYNGDREGYNRNNLLNRIQEHQFGLARLGALDEADEIGRLSHSLRAGFTGDVRRQLETQFKRSRET